MQGRYGFTPIEITGIALSASPLLLGYLSQGRWPESLHEAAPYIGTTAMLLAALVALALSSRKIRSLEAALAEAQQLDHLTGLGNRAAFDRRLAVELQRWQRTGAPLSLVAIDLIGTSDLNTWLGFEVGNRLIELAAQKIKEAIRSGVDEAFRLGGDEFVIILPETSQAGAKTAAARLQAAVCSMSLERYGQVIFQADCKTGYATARELNAEQLLEDVMQALEAPEKPDLCAA
jgi:diguanylate cyclase (GGDEF)-like protein